MNDLPSIEITKEMISAANDLVKSVNVNRTKASEIDTITGILGEFVFAQFFYGDWKKHYLTTNVKGIVVYDHPPT